MIATMAEAGNMERFIVSYNEQNLELTADEVQLICTDPERIQDFITSNSNHDQSAMSSMSDVSAACSYSSSCIESEETESGSNRSAYMPKEAVSLLISLHQSHEKEFSSKTTKKKNVWEKIAQELSKQGYTYTWLQIKNKWCNITQKYRKVNDHNRLTGRNPKTCPHFEELNNYLGCRPNVTPSCIKSSRPIDSEDLIPENKNDDDLEAETESIHSESASDVTEKPKAKRRVSDRTRAVMKVIEEQEASRKQDTDRIIQELRQQHEEQMKMENEKLATEKAKIEIFKQIIEKF